MRDFGRVNEEKNGEKGITVEIIELKEEEHVVKICKRRTIKSVK